MTLTKLPTEILTVILSEFLDRATVKNVCEVSRRLYAVAAPVLYKSVRVIVDDYEHDQISVDGILGAHRRANVLQYTKDIQFLPRGPIFHDMERCPHLSTHMVESSEVEDGNTIPNDDLTASQEKDRERWSPIKTSADLQREEEAYRQLKENLEAMARLKNKNILLTANSRDHEEFKDRLIALLIRCQPGKLKKFTWGLDACIPPEVLGEGGYLTTRQKNLEALQMFCRNACGVVKYDLKHFKGLKRFSWSGMCRQDDFDSLANVLRASSSQLERLDISLEFWNKMNTQPNRRAEMDIAENVFSLEKGGQKLRFPALKHLYLSDFYFMFTSAGMASVFNSPALTSLTLRSCLHWELFLEELRYAERPPPLRTLEVISRCSAEETEMEAAYLSCHLDEIEEGLEELFVSTEFSVGTLELWESMARHRSTLRTFVHHPRSPGDGRHFESPYDLDYATIKFPPGQKVEHSWNPLRQLNLECIGVNYDLQYLRPILTTFKKDGSLLVLHIRHSPAHFHEEAVSREEKNLPPWETLDDFIEWVFGPDGFQSVRVLVIGDFNDADRYSGHDLMFCRQTDAVSGGPPEDNYRTITEHDTFERGLLEKYDHVFHACLDEPPTHDGMLFDAMEL
ncbi:hypothetical protein FQN49_005315 [Arthroderma sp. PD_2]|nr:hypothetical protein FQN49_005315 [Arthroderma sp. PD_2]